MPLRSDYFKTARGSGLFVKLYIGTAARHVRGYRNRSVDSRLRDYLSLALMEFSVEDIMRYSASFKHRAYFLGLLDSDGADKTRLSFRMRLGYLVHHSVELLTARLVDRVLIINTDNRLIGGYFDNIHSVYFPELVFFRQGGTGHSGFFLVFIKEVLESDSCERPALALHLHMLFCLDRLMQSVGISSSGHYTSGKLVYDKHLIVFYYIILIPEHKIIGSERKYDIVLYLQIIRVR